jgi:hypothetical protein
MPPVYTRSRQLIRALLRRPAAPTAEEIFTEIFKTNAFLGKTSVSGTGSDPDQTETVIAELPKLFRRFDISTVLDIPCGDFSWMSCVDLSGIKYLGADIVKELISQNVAKYGSENISFMYRNMIADRLPPSDLILCRDGLVHLSFAEIRRSIANICDSGSTYLLATTFTATQCNKDTEGVNWRPLNLQIAPFNFPPPLAMIIEGCTENDGVFKDKSLGLWRITELDSAGKIGGKRVEPTFPL